MIGSFETLVAQTERTFVEFVPLLPLTTGAHFTIALLALVVLVGLIVWLYRRDGVELPASVTTTLSWLRVVAVIGLVVFFINPEMRSEKQVVKTSRVAVLVDTSLSMGIRDRDEGQIDVPSRIQQVRDLLAGDEMLDELRQSHDVVVYRFDETTRPVELATLGKLGGDLIEDEGPTLTQAERWSRASWLFRAGLFVSVLGLVVGSLASLWRLLGGVPALGWAALVGTLALTAGYGTLMYGHLLVPGVAPLDLLMSSSPDRSTEEAAPEDSADEPQADEEATEKSPSDWLAQLEPQGVSTRLGETLRYLVNQERGGPIAGLIVVSDGQKNAGAEPDLAIAGARESGIPLITVGVGSNRPLQNVEVADIRAPKRVFPSDKFTVRGLLQSSGMGGQTVEVQLISVDEQGNEAEQLEGEEQVDLAIDGSPVPVEFEVASGEEGKRIFEVRVVAPPNDFDNTDNSRSALVEIIERKSRVLTIAGGPTREYRFLRNQLYRDPEVISDVWLQTAPEGIAQEADTLLEDFPATREELFQYDCVIAFDPDWRMLSVAQVQLLEEWVAEQAGGLVVIAGPVYTPEWTRAGRGDEAIDLIRRLYPVSFFSQNTGSIKIGRFGGEEAFPLSFTREGVSSEFLWLGDTAQESTDNWTAFDGVFGYYAVNEPKPGAVVFANFSDPSTAFDQRLPIYLAGHFYGAGRVYFQASGEMWRLREVDVEYFELYYAKLIRWASQGRLLRDSTRGVLLVDQERVWLGDRVMLQAMLRDDQNQPLAAREVTVTVLLPDRQTMEVTLSSLSDGARPGTFSGQFTATQEGDYRVSLLVPGSSDGEVLTSGFRADIPDLEKDKPQRNDDLLAEMAELTGGQYVAPLPETYAESSLQQAIKGLDARDQVSYLPGTPDSDFTKSLMAWLLGLVAGALCLEWLTRRLNRLA